MNQASGLLLDTDVVVEVRSASPDPSVIRFLELRRHQRLYVSVLTVGDLYGLHSHEQADEESGRQWVEELRRRFPANILSIDPAVAAERGSLTSAPDLPPIDSLIAATALRHRLTVVCRDVNRFAELGLNVITPYAYKQ
ncbi:PIN domain-containing protein [Arthrobacter monumenti]